MGFEVSLGPCLEARVFGSWKGRKGISKALGVGRGSSGHLHHREFSRGATCRDRERSSGDKWEAAIRCSGYLTGSG